MTQAKHLVPVAPVIEIAPSSPIDDNRSLINGHGTERNRRRERMMPARRSQRPISRFSFPLSLALLASLHTGTPAWARLGHRLIAQLAERHLNPKARESLNDTDRELSANFHQLASAMTSASLPGRPPSKPDKSLSSFLLSFHPRATESGLTFLVSIERGTSRRLC
jgi:hypothetical protein